MSGFVADPKTGVRVKLQKCMIDDLWLQEREPYFGSELIPVERPAHSGHGKKRIDQCKAKHRTDIKVNEWAEANYWGTTSTADLIGADVAYPVSPQIDRVHQSRLSVEQFIETYEKPAIPCMLTGCADHWKARTEWSYENFLKRYGNVLLKCGEDDDGYKVKIKVKYFLEYMYLQRDDSPLYLFDSSFDESADTKGLLDHYDLPKYFREDLFRLVGEKRRPPYRWFLIGPKRSGTTVHIDPLATSAWNTLIRGRKRWILFPPETPQKLVKGKHHVKPHEDDEAIDWFLKILPRIKAEGRARGNFTYVEFIQYPGDTIFLPGGWWHAVLNIDDSVAVTQNFCDSTNFCEVWLKTRKGRKKMAVKFLEQLDIHYPHLAAKARALNARDSFVMRQISSKADKKRKKRDKDDANGGTGATAEADSIRTKALKTEIDGSPNDMDGLDEDLAKLKSGKHSRKHNSNKTVHLASAALPGDTKDDDSSSSDSTSSSSSSSSSSEDEDDAY